MAQIGQPSTALVAMIDKEKDQIAKMLPSFMADQKDRFFQLVLAMQKVPDIANCSPASVLGSIYKAAQWGLMVDGVHSALVPYGRDCTFVPMYKGLIAAYRRSGEIKNVWADVVFRGDKIEVVRGTDPKLNHEPDLSLNRVDPTDVIGAYACARWTNGSVDFVYMNRSELEAIKERSRAKNGPWRTDPVAMFRKCPLRRLGSILPLAVDIQVLVQEEEKADIGSLDIPGEVVQAPTTLEGLLQTPAPAPEEAPEVWLSEIRIEQPPYDRWCKDLTGSKNPKLGGLTWEQIAASDDKEVVAACDALLETARETQRDKGSTPVPFQRLAVTCAERIKRLQAQALQKEAEQTF